MRRILRILNWLGVSLSALLLAGTLFLWVRGVGHHERWVVERFEPDPRWKEWPWAPGTARRWIAGPTRGRLWMGWQTMSPMHEIRSQAWHHRRSMTADEANQQFQTLFQPRQLSTPSGWLDRSWNWAGVGFRHGREPGDPQTAQPTFESFSLAIPVWMLALLFGLWPTAVLARRLLRPKRYAPGLCPSCGYDLRATPDPSGPALPRCPECGQQRVEQANSP